MNKAKAKGLGLVTAAAVAAALAAGLLATQVSAQEETIRVGSGTAVVGAEVSVDLDALGMAAPGLGAWSIDIVYDAAVVTATACNPQNGSVCNTSYAADTVRVVGASASGLVGDNTLASLTFSCDAEGASALTVVIQSLADATPGDLQAIDAAVESGSVSCGPAAGPTETIKVGSLAMAPGEEGTVDLDSLNMSAPGLGAWTIDVTYDPAVVSAAACVPSQGGVCNADFDDNTVRATGANADGLEGDNTLAEISFRCDIEGSSALELTVQVLVDATVGDPQFIAATTVNGTITCAVATPAGATATPTATPTAGLPIAGLGGFDSDGGSPLGWLVAGLIGAGLAWLIAGLAGAGFATMRLRAAEQPFRTGTTIPTSSVVSTRQAPRPRHATASDAAKPRSWFSAAREELARGGPARMPGFRKSRRGEPRS